MMVMISTQLNHGYHINHIKSSSESGIGGRKATKNPRKSASSAVQLFLRSAEPNQNLNPRNFFFTSWQRFQKRFRFYYVFKQKRSHPTISNIKQVF